MGNKRGFTLLEVLIVIIIIGVLAGLAIPAYQAAVEKSRSQEALQALSATRESLVRLHAQNGSYAAATFTTGQAGTLDYNPNLAIGGQVLRFSYALSGLGTNTFVITATRVNQPGESASGTITLNQAGTVTKTGDYA